MRVILISLKLLVLFVVASTPFAYSNSESPRELSDHVRSLLIEVLNHEISYRLLEGVHGNWEQWPFNDCKLRHLVSDLCFRPPFQNLDLRTDPATGLDTAIFRFTDETNLILVVQSITNHENSLVDSHKTVLRTIESVGVISELPDLPIGLDGREFRAEDGSPVWLSVANFATPFSDKSTSKIMTFSGEQGEFRYYGIAFLEAQRDERMQTVLFKTIWCQMAIRGTEDSNSGAFGCD